MKYLLLMFFSLSSSFSNECPGHLEAKLNFSKSIHQKDSKFHIRPEVEGRQSRLKKLGESTTQKPPEKIRAYLEAMERVHDGARKSEFAESRLRNKLYDDFVIKGAKLRYNEFIYTINENMSDKKKARF